MPQYACHDAQRNGSFHYCKTNPVTMKRRDLWCDGCLHGTENKSLFQYTLTPPNEKDVIE